MRILMLNYEYPPLGGGAGPMSKELAENLVNRGHKVDFVTMRYNGQKKDETINGVHVYRVPCIRKRKATCNTPEMLTYVASAIKFTLKLTKKKKYDIVHSHFIIPTGIVAYVLKKTRGLDYIISVHGSDVPGYNPDRFGMVHKVTKPLLKRIIRNSKMTVPLSNYLKNLILKNISGDVELKVIPNGIDLDLFKKKKKKKWILMSGRLLSRKGFHHVLEALKDVDAPGWEVHITGDGPIRQDLESIAKGLKMKVIFHGWLDSKKDVYRFCEQSSIYCLTSSNENASIALLEAMLSGNAVLTVNDTGCIETVGDTALVVDFGDVGAISGALKKLIGDEKYRLALGEKAQKRVKAHYGWKKIVDDYEGLMKKRSQL